MKTYFAAIVISLSLVASVASNPVIGQPEPVPTSTGTPTFHCGGTSNLTCPTGWRCCGPFVSLDGLSGPVAGSISGEIAVSITYGFELSSETQRHVQLSRNAIDPLIAALTPGGSVLVEAIPILRYLPSWAPGASFNRIARMADEFRKQMFEVTFTEAIGSRGAGNLAPSLVSCSVDNIDPSGDVRKQEEDIKLIAGSIYAAAGETVS
ncbi:hypothetical protein BJ165DRAFT_1614321 [Panaeolus papilionaceus]|nr:hypothetical protein BJ165DRAFT_1614321 [Panaeolus papilionaceus]